MRALTVTQPWAGLIASRIKLLENRPRTMVKEKDIGVPFAIHAGRAIDESTYDRIEEIAPDLDWCRPRWGTCDLLGSHTGEHWTVTTGSPPPSRPSWRALSRITSSVIAIATFDKVFTGWTSESIAEHGAALSDSTGALIGPAQVRWFFGPVGYLLRDVRALPSPVPCRGALGFWTLPDDIARAVTESAS